MNCLKVERWAGGLVLPATLLPATLAMIAAPALAQDGPPAGRPGECYAQVMHAPVYRTVTEQAPGPQIVSYRKTPAVIAHGSRQVLVAPARTERQIVPATYTVAKRWSEVPGKARYVRTAAVYQTVNERQLVSPAHLEWRPGSSTGGFQSNGGGYGQSVRPTGEVLCRILVPDQYASVSRQVLVTPAGWRRVQGPPRRVVCYDRVVAAPARVIEHQVPAQYRTVQTTWTVKPATRERVVAPGPLRAVQRRVMVTPARSEWTPLNCRSVHRQASHWSTGPSGPDADPSHGVGRQTKGQPYQPNEILAPAPSYPPTLGPSPPYDVGHPAR